MNQSRFTQCMFIFFIAFCNCHSVSAQDGRGYSGTWYGRVFQTIGTDTVFGKAKLSIPDIAKGTDKCQAILRFFNLSGGNKDQMYTIDCRFTESSTGYTILSYPGSLQVKGKKRGVKGYFAYRLYYDNGTPSMRSTFYPNDNEKDKDAEREFFLVNLQKEVPVEAPSTQNSLINSNTATKPAATTSPTNQGNASVNNQPSDYSDQATSFDTTIKTHIDPKQVAGLYRKDFQWNSWSAAPAGWKAAAAAIITVRKQKLGDEIAARVASGCKAHVAPVDLNADGTIGFIVRFSGCGNENEYLCYEGGGYRGMEFSTNDPLSAIGDGKLLAGRVKHEYDIRTSFGTGDARAIGKIYEYPRVLPVKPGGPGGGKTPDALGRTILKALLTNDFKLWESCMLPDECYIHKDNVDMWHYNYMAAFQDLRNSLEEAGFTRSSAIKFERVVFSRDAAWGDKDGGVVRGEQVRRDFKIEISYNNEFLATIGDATIQTCKNGNYYVHNSIGVFRSHRK